MENNRPVKTFAFLLTMGMFISFPLFVSAYSDETTHPGLTVETVKFFNIYFPNLELGDTEKELLMKGSVEEDINIRAMHHFYDPMYERGITIVGIEWSKSKEWAKDTLAQAGIVASMTAGTLNSFFNGESDYSWDRAIYEYAWGNKERGLEALGHVIHLIQDASVPDHTRNDPHPPAFHFGSPYEQWTAQFGPENIDVASNLRDKKPAQLAGLDAYFNSIATYSNNNFFSKDTIFSENYSKPVILYESKKFLIDGEPYKFGYSQFGKLVLINENIITLAKAYSIEDKDNLILSDYWNLLSQQAVLHGAGVVKFFFDEVEKEKKTKVLYNKNKNWFQKFYDATQGKIFNVAGALYGSSVTFEELQELTGESETSNASRDIVAASTVGHPMSSSEEEDDAEPAPTQIFDATNESVNALDIGRPEIEVGEDTPTQPQEVPDPAQGALPTLYPPGSSGGGSDYGGAPIAPQNNADNTQNNAEDTTEEESAASVSISAPIVTSPSSSSWRIGTTTVTFSGIASTTLVVANDFNSATTSPDLNENWSLTFSNVSEGETTFKFWTIGTDSATSTSLSKTITVDLTAPTVNSFNILQCTYSLTTSTCLSGGSTANITWSSAASDISYSAIEKDGVVVATTSSTSYDLVLGNGTYSIAVGIYDTVGNAATSSAKSITVFQNPIVINEIAWAGTEASANDEWVELYNRSSYTIDLSRVSLVASDGVPAIALSGIATSSDYYLLERTDDTTTSVNADLVTAFSGDGGGSGLSNGGEVLSLAHYLGGLATTTLDSTPALADCSGGWCAGSADTAPKSMERKSVSTSGATASNWQSNNTFTKNGTDANGTALNGTPASQNSVSTLSVGYYCPSYSTTFAEGGYYIPTSGLCTYLSSAITSGTRYGDLYKGTVASSTIINGHSLGSNATSTQNNDKLPSPVQGARFFTAIYKVRSGPAFDDVDDFRNYFKTGANPPPHLEYGVINWLYGTTP